MIVKEVLSDDGELESAGDVPADTDVELCVIRDGSRHASIIHGPGIHPSQGGIELDVAGYVDRGTQRELLLRVCRFVEGVVEIEAARFDPQVLLQQAVTGMKPPAIECLHGRTELEAVGFAFEVVLEEERERQVEDGVRGAGGSTAQVIVLVIEGGERGVDFRTELGAITDLVGEQGFGLEAGPALQQDDEKSGRGLGDVAVDA